MNKKQWEAQVKACNASGLSKSEYAKQHGLVYHNLCLVSLNQNRGR